MEPLELCVARRLGAEWLILPNSPVLAARGLALYPAQTPKARWARRTLAWALRLGLKPGLRGTDLTLSPADPFVGFLRATAKLTPAAPLRFALLAGNPSVPGRRFVLLLFGADGQPAAVVKAGVSEAARQLLDREESFLRHVSAALPGVPPLRGTFHDHRIRALVLDYFAGDSPGAGDTAHLSEMLGRWLAEDRWVRLDELPAWRRLLAADVSPALFAPLRQLGGLRLHPTVAHGDFAPWNIKAAGGRWTVLDWERGELNGVPGWDWFHFMLQPALLVRRDRPAALLGLCESVLRSSAFVAYAERAGVGAHTRELALGYLVTCLQVNRQTEGHENLQALLDLALTRWSGAR